MKKIVLMEADTLKAVEEFAAGLESAEQLVDKVLSAARIQRTERQPISHENLCALLVAGCVALAILLFGTCLGLVIIF